MTFGPGSRLGRYQISGSLGAGGMAEVYLAEDTELGRRVALKILPTDATTDAHARKRLLREARAAAGLDHPHICAVYDVGEVNGRPFIAMQYVEGETLDARLKRHPLDVPDALAIACDIADALTDAHARGIIHRDIKPSNVMITPRGRAVVLDFGLAKLADPADEAPPDAATESVLSAPGAVMGTVPYMSPEQVRGEPLDGRSDLFSFGVVVYEMLSGHRPFAAPSAAAVASAILTGEPAPLARFQTSLPAELERIVGKALRKNRDGRYQTAKDLLIDLRTLRDDQEFQRRLDRTPRSAASDRDTALATAPLTEQAAATTSPRPDAAPSGPTEPLAPGPAMRGGIGRLWLGAAAASLVFLVGLAAVWIRGGDERWARNEALPALEALVREQKLFQAFVLAREIERRAPDNGALAGLWPRFAREARIESEPPAAEVELQDYTAPDSGWYRIGQTPIDFRIPDQPVRIRVTAPGFEAIEAAPPAALDAEGSRLVFAFRLDAAGAAPVGMVRVRGGTVAHGGAAPVDVDDFWIDRLEVTNQDFQRFVDDGGYRRPELWRHPVVDQGRTLTWAEAVATFLDKTDRPGPATWELGRFPDGAGALPVGGVTWYEAAAYAEWAGKALPSYYHWYRAAQPDVFSEILSFSRIGGDGPVAAGSLAGLGPWGTLDMAGNVKEWASNATGPLRFALGGAWSDPPYLFTEPEAFAPMRRTPDLGFRCIKLDQPARAAMLAPVERTLRDFARERPASDEVYAALASVYSYDRAAPLDVRHESTDDSAPYWRLERVSVAAAYGKERLPLLLFLPKDTPAPHSAVLYVPESTAEATASSLNIQTRYFEFFIRSGRAVVVPVFKNMYERQLPGPVVWSPTWRRDLVIAWSKDLGRALDYLQTREDFDSEKFALYGFSLGAIYGPILAALEPRLRAAVFLGGGLADSVLPPEADPIQFAPRVRMPTLMIAGREDFVRPVERSQRPIFVLLGSPPDQKRLAVLDGGHLPARLTDVMREALAWLDRWLGPVR